MGKLKVKARAGIKVPLAHNPKKYITDAEAVEVDDNVYYRRGLREGDLLLVADTVAPDAEPETQDTKRGKK